MYKYDNKVNSNEEIKMLKQGLLSHWIDLHTLNKTLGHRNDIFRNVEDSFVLKYGEFKNQDIVLDVGSGDSTVPAFIRTKHSSTVYVIDIDINMLESQKKYCSALNCELNIEEQDATNLKYPDEYFDKIIAISSIEHIPDDGDIYCAKEFSRVLKKGGKCLITVPFGDYEEIKNPWYYSGFERRYDLENLNKRLLSAPKMKIDKLLFLSTPETEFVHEVWEKVGNIFEMYYKGNYHITKDDISIGLTLGWIELTEVPRSSFGALICLTK
jgi:SAM-dependent methyltransferase